MLLTNVRSLRATSSYCFYFKTLIIKVTPNETSTSWLRIPIKSSYFLDCHVHLLSLFVVVLFLHVAHLPRPSAVNRQVLVLEGVGGRTFTSRASRRHPVTFRSSLDAEINNTSGRIVVRGLNWPCKVCLLYQLFHF